ncbi:hypothetical protein FPOAC1_001531 [Fusarium poae]|uniref:hypothetical protein n=1 Tax=Fusarium poae TaxID=36050 RepID=UPI001CE76BE1|nr:hypothetical protein FPOAC1_001531 [Fusarium poae]KAG8675550.1 hypothetical protein FPOAC1_001531 [Fusarium poae]
MAHLQSTSQPSRSSPGEALQELTHVVNQTVCALHLIVIACTVLHPSLRDRAAKAGSGRASPAADNAIGRPWLSRSLSGHSLRLRLGERWMPDDVLT